MISTLCLRFIHHWWSLATLFATIHTVLMPFRFLRMPCARSVVVCLSGFVQALESPGKGHRSWKVLELLTSSSGIVSSGLSSC